MRRGGGFVVCLLAISCILAPGTALADHDRLVPGGLTGSVSTTHFVVHYNPGSTTGQAGMSIATYAQLGAADFEEAYSHEAISGTGTPNAGLRDPVPDADGKTDVYLAAPTNNPGFFGGRVYDDSAGHTPVASYVFMTPGLNRGGFRFRAGHEFIHVLQSAYSTCCREQLFEGEANWGAEYSLPDINPLDHNFYGDSDPPSTPTPWVPLDCPSSLGWDGRGCGGDYWTWLFFQHVTETYDGGFVADYLERFRNNPAGVATMLDLELQAANPSDNLGNHFAEYSRDVWDPTRWQTTAISEIHAVDGQPAAFKVDRSVPGNDTGTQNVQVDHLSNRYLQIAYSGGFQPTGPNDQLRVTVNRPAGLIGNANDFLMRLTTQQALSDVDQGLNPITLTLDPAVTRELIFPLTNNTYVDANTTDDNLPFSYRVEFLPGTPTPPPNDTKPGAITAALGVPTGSDSVYAGGRGVDEAPGCSLSSQIDATRGVWFRFTTPDDGLFSYDASASDFPTVVSLYDAATGAWAGCAGDGRMDIEQPGGHTYDIYLGRSAGFVVTGSQARLTVGGQLAGKPPMPTPGPGPGPAKKKCKNKKGKRSALAAKKCKKKKKKRSAVEAKLAAFSLAGQPEVSSSVRVLGTTDRLSSP